MSLSTEAVRPAPFAAAKFGAELLPDALSALDRVGTIHLLDRDATLFREGDPATFYYKVLSGAVRGCKLLADGRRHVGDFHLPGDFIGLAAEGSYRFTAEAVTSTTIVRYARSNVDRLASQEPSIGQELLKIVCHGFSAAHRQLVSLARKTAGERIAAFLLDLAQRSGEQDRVVLPMNRNDIGDHLGLTMETVSRELSRLKSEGIIDLANSHSIVFRDRAALEDLAEAA